MLSENVTPIRDFVETAVLLLPGMTVSTAGGVVSGAVWCTAITQPRYGV